ncbi:hypothetical protein CR205_10560 [Alteribacter lacisalsi]|uniref:Uncharacterized protein n=2 Tax=Alteribacter lacisalsi TaxID=2045244 RepID=A0A2W0HGF7_9BACI|nr:hypothetical protein CR205_10560 [Alteribacter lacisalsi]
MLIYLLLLSDYAGQALFETLAGFTRNYLLTCNKNAAPGSDFMLGTQRDIQRRSVQMDKTNAKSLIIVGISGILFITFIITMYQIGVDGIDVISSGLFFFLGMLFLASVITNIKQKRLRWVVYLAIAFFFFYQIISILTAHFA